MLGIIILGICVSSGLHFRRQSRLLEEAYALASTDRLTGLLNRSGLNDLLHSEPVATQLRNGQIAVIFLDIDDFKQLNDRFGHEDGDRALRITAERLSACIRSTDYVVRLGGDEFICLVADDDPRAAADTIARRIADACRDPIGFGDQLIVLRPSIGIATSNSGADWDALLGQADTAMYLAKRAKADRPMHFDARHADRFTPGHHTAGRSEEC
jgi:diguanylate cyclase (GGDEF)-like protein